MLFTATIQLCGLCTKTGWLQPASSLKTSFVKNNRSAHERAAAASLIGVA